MFQPTPNRICIMFGRPQGKPVSGRALSFRSAGQVSLQSFLSSVSDFANNQTGFFLPLTAEAVRQQRIPARESGFADRRNRRVSLTKRTDLLIFSEMLQAGHIRAITEK